MRNEKRPIFTIGHSNHPFAHFVAMLQSAHIDTLIDVRSFPRSRTNPQFNTDSLPEALAPYQISYAHWPDLGGRRKAQAAIAPEINAYWQNQSFHNYADYALSSDFQQALAALIDTTAHQRPALMCSEAVWWRCHRRIITDHLLARDLSVFHIMDIGKAPAAKLTPGAIIQPPHWVEYPATTDQDV